MKHFIKPAKEAELEKEDIQGLIVRGYNSLNAASYILLKIDNDKVDEAKKYFNLLIQNNYITTGDVTSKKFTNSNDPEKAVQIAFTSSGIKKLLFDKSILDTFSREFIEGMSHSWTNTDNKIITERSTLLGDTGNNQPDYWDWGNDKTPVDCMLMLYAENKQALKMLIATVFDTTQKWIQWSCIKETFEYDPKISKEHFGFRDGISQPTIKGLSKSGTEKNKDNLINSGEFILGYKNEYSNYSPSPYVDTGQLSNQLPNSPVFKNKKDLGKNGCYLVFRQMEQHVERFWQHLYKYSKEEEVSQTGKAVKLASKMVGRWPEGQPLATCPYSGCAIDEKALNDFSYYNVDKDGVNCPLGAHIRRTNPRDQVHTISATIVSKEIVKKVSKEIVKKHRMLRRGRIYGKAIDEKFEIDTIIAKSKDKVIAKETKGPTSIEKGLHFICMVSDIARQFEFVQNVWANTSTFGNLCNEVDPVISPRPTVDQPNCHEFSTPQNIIRNRYKEVPEFTTVVGGAYFFMPGIKALKYIIGS